MKKAVLLVLASVFLSGSARAATSNAYDYEDITVTTSAVATLSASKLSPVGSSPPVDAFISLETSSCRWRVDGGDPTASVGHLIVSSDTLTLEGLNNLKNFRILGVGAGSANLHVTYER